MTPKAAPTKPTRGGTAVEQERLARAFRMSVYRGEIQLPAHITNVSTSSQAQIPDSQLPLGTHAASGPAEQAVSFVYETVSFGSNTAADQNHGPPSVTGDGYPRPTQHGSERPWEVQTPSTMAHGAGTAARPATLERVPRPARRTSSLNTNPTRAQSRPAQTPSPATASGSMQSHSRSMTSGRNVPSNVPQVVGPAPAFVPPMATQLSQYGGRVMSQSTHSIPHGYNGTPHPANAGTHYTLHVVPPQQFVLQAPNMTQTSSYHFERSHLERNVPTLRHPARNPPAFHHTTPGNGLSAYVGQPHQPVNTNANPGPVYPPTTSAAASSNSGRIPHRDSRLASVYNRSASSRVELGPVTQGDSVNGRGRLAPAVPSQRPQLVGTGSVAPAVLNFRNSSVSRKGKRCANDEGQSEQGVKRVRYGAEPVCLGLENALPAVENKELNIEPAHIENVASAANCIEEPTPLPSLLTDEHEAEIVAHAEQTGARLIDINDPYLWSLDLFAESGEVAG